MVARNMNPVNQLSFARAKLETEIFHAMESHARGGRNDFSNIEAASKWAVICTALETKLVAINAVRVERGLDPFKWQPQND